MQRLINFIWVLPAWALVALSPVSAQTLEEAVRTAVASHPQVSRARAEKRAADAQVREARAGYFPSVELLARVGRERSDFDSLRLAGRDDRYLTRSGAGLKLTQTVFDGFETQSNVERRLALLEAAESRAADVRERVAFEAVQAFLDVLRAERLVELAEENVAEHETTFGKVNLRVRRGVSERADLEQARGRLALARSALTARRGALWESRTVYERVVGEPPARLSLPGAAPPRLTGDDGAVISLRLDEAIRSETDVAVEENYALRAVQAEVEAADAAVARTRAAFFPTVTLEAGSNRDRNVSGVTGARNVDSVMLLAKWNLFNGGADTARARAAAERKMAALDEAADTRRAVEENVALALRAKAASEARLPFLREHVEASNSTLSAYESQLEIGRRSLLDTLNAKSEVFSALSNLLVGEFEDLSNQYFIAASKGQLLESLGLASEDGDNSVRAGAH